MVLTKEGAKITTKQLALFTILSPNIGMMLPVEHVLCRGLGSDWLYREQHHGLSTLPSAELTDLRSQ